MTAVAESKVDNITEVAKDSKQGMNCDAGFSKTVQWC
jgi:hypothetical protein